MSRKIVSVFLAVLLVIISTLPVYAKTLQEQKQELQDKLNDAKEDKSEITNQKNKILDEISELNADISVYESEIDELNSKIKKLEKSINEKQTEITKLQEESEEKQEALVKRLVAMYEAGQTTYLDMLLTSDSVTNFISNYYMISQLAEADQAVIDSIEEKQQKIEENKKELEEEKEEIDTSKKEIETKNNKLVLAKKSKQTRVNKLTADEKALQTKIDSFNAAIKEANKKIQEEAASSGGYNGSFSGMFSWPVSSTSSWYNYISSYYGKRPSPTAGASSNHGAIDIPISYQPIYAAADGKVTIAKWLSGYGNYIFIDHGNGYYTGYAHLSGYSVKKGQTVKRGQKIGTSGNTGISTGPHLHFEVYKGGTDNKYRVDPLEYTTHPKPLYSL